jgi:hypothetical protein
LRVLEGQTAELDGSRLGAGWRGDEPTSLTPPLVRLQDGKLFIRPGSGALKLGSQQVAQDEVEVPLGSQLAFGEFTKMRVDAVVETTLAVRSVFGNVAQTSSTIVVQMSDSGQASLAPKGPTYAQRGEVR